MYMKEAACPCSHARNRHLKHYHKISHLILYEKWYNPVFDSFKEAERP